MKIQFTATNYAECKNFLTIKNKQDNCFITLEEFIKLNPTISKSCLDNCIINYRGRIIDFTQYVNEYLNITEGLLFYDYTTLVGTYFNFDDRAALYHIQKASDCLQTARYYAIKSSLLLDYDLNMPWKYGYQPQFYFRCVNFGTAASWYANCFDYILQIVYWGFSLYQNVVDKQKQKYNQTWDKKKILKLCNYNFVINELERNKLNSLKTAIELCYKQCASIKRITNYIKHKSGVDYLYLLPKPLGECFFSKRELSEDEMKQMIFSNAKMPNVERIEEFESPIKIDIDKSINDLHIAHKALHNCLVKVVNELDLISRKLF